MCITWLVILVWCRIKIHRRRWCNPATTKNWPGSVSWETKSNTRLIRVSKYYLDRNGQRSGSSTTGCRPCYAPQRKSACTSPERPKGRVTRVPSSIHGSIHIHSRSHETAQPQQQPCHFPLWSAFALARGLEPAVRSVTGMMAWLALGFRNAGFQVSKVPTVRPSGAQHR